MQDGFEGDVGQFEVGGDGEWYEYGGVVFECFVVDQCQELVVGDYCDVDDDGVCECGDQVGLYCQFVEFGCGG